MVMICGVTISIQGEGGGEEHEEVESIFGFVVVFR
jgi:hypothetical protein